MISIGSVNQYLNPYSIKPIQGYNRSYSAANMKKLSSIIDSQKNKFSAFATQVSDYNKTAKSFYGGLYSSLGDLKQSSSALKSFSADSVLNPAGYGSNNSSVAVVDRSNQYYTKPMELNVKNVATAEIKDSKALSATQTGQFTGKSELNVTVGGKSTVLKFDFSAQTTNKSAMSQMASAINSAGLGITAKTVEKDGKTTLNIQSDTTGAKSAFSAEATGSAKDALELSATTAAGDASYSVDGTEYTSSTNKVSLKDGVEATLKGAGTATLGEAASDTARIVDAVKTFAKDFNNTLDYLKNNASLSANVADLSYSFSAASKFSTNKLASIGIQTDSNGKLSVDESTLKQALSTEPKKVASLLGEYGGLASEVNRKTTSTLNTSQVLLPVPKPTNDSYKAYLYSKEFAGITPQSPVYTSGALMNLFA